MRKLSLFISILCLMVFITGCGKDANLDSNNSNSTSSNQEDVQPLSSTTSYKVKFSNFEFEIPDDLLYETYSDSLVVGNREETWIMELYIADGNYEQLKSNRSMLQSYFKQNGVDSTAAEVKNISGREFITLEFDDGTEKFIGAYSKLNSMKMAWLAIYAKSNDFDYSIFDKITPILNSAVYNESMNNIEDSKKFDFNIDEIAQFGK